MAKVAILHFIKKSRFRAIFYPGLLSVPSAVEPFHYVWPVGNNDVHQVKYCQGGCKPQSITPKLPAQSKLFHTVNIFGLNKHFLPRQAGGILFCAGNDTFFCLEPPRSTFRAGFGGIFLLGRRVVSSSAPEMIPFSARNRLGAPSVPDFGHFPARQAGGIPFCAKKNTIFVAEPRRRTPSRRNATCDTNL